MDFYEMKLHQRFEPSGATRNAQAEVDAFYSSFGRKTALYTRLQEKLVFRAKLRDTAIVPSTRPVLPKTIG